MESEAGGSAGPVPDLRRVSIDEDRACPIQADQLDHDTMPSEFADHLFQRADRGDVP